MVVFCSIGHLPLTDDLALREALGICNDLDDMGNMIPRE
jgi:hypothetical protein